MPQNKVSQLTTAGMLLAIGLILPFVTAHELGIPGTTLLPMHIPVLLTGLLCGPLYGALCGILTPLLSSLLTQMPPAFPMLPIMMGELFTYGLVSGLLLYRTFLRRKRGGVLVALIAAMACGRVVYAGIFQALVVTFGELKALSAGAALVTGLPGIVAQLILIPCLVEAVRSHARAGRRDAVQSAIHLIEEGTATCVVIRDNQIVKTEYGSGIGPMVALYESGMLKDAFVVDKIIEKAAAMLLVLGGSAGCYGMVMSQAAIAYLTRHHRKVFYGAKALTIVNRQRTGLCPMEQAVSALEDPEEGLTALKSKLEELKQAQ